MQKHLQCKKWHGQVSRNIPDSECMKRLMTKRSDITMQPRLSYTEYIAKYYTGHIEATVFEL